jgi:hypothetical protein
MAFSQRTHTSAVVKFIEWTKPPLPLPPLCAIVVVKLGSATGEM